MSDNNDECLQEKADYSQIILSQVSEREKYTDILKKLGGKVIDSPQKGSILVCEDLKRTFKVLVAICRGIPIVRPDWLRESKLRKKFVNPDPYHLVDSNYEICHRFELKKSLGNLNHNTSFV